MSTPMSRGFATKKAKQRQSTKYNLDSVRSQPIPTSDTRNGGLGRINKTPKPFVSPIKINTNENGDKSAAATSTNLASPSKIIRDKLEHLATSFHGFEEKVNEKKRRHEKQHELKLVDLKQEIVKINKSLQAECKTRDEQIKTSAHSLDMKIKKVKQSLESPLDAKFDGIVQSIEYLSHKLDEMERRQKLENEKFESVIQTSYNALAEKLQDYEHEFTAHCSRSKEQSEVLRKLIHDEQHKITRFISNEQQQRDKKVSVIEREMEKEINQRTQHNKAIEQYLSSNIEKLNAKIKESEKERVESTEQVVKALCHYTTALHDGVQIVSSSPS